MLGVAEWLRPYRGTTGLAPAAVLQARIQVAFLVLAAASFGIFLVRRRHLRQLRPWR